MKVLPVTYRGFFIGDTQVCVSYLFHEIGKSIFVPVPHL